MNRLDRSGVQTDRDVQLANFARYVLRCMESQQDWSASTLDDIADFARTLGLAEDNSEGCFKATDKPLPVGPHDRSWCG